MKNNKGFLKKKCQNLETKNIFFTFHHFIFLISVKNYKVSIYVTLTPTGKSNSRLMMVLFAKQNIYLIWNECSQSHIFYHKYQFEKKLIA